MNAERVLALYEKVAEAPDAVPRLRRFVLDLAVRGKLVPQDASDEPASELLKRISAEKALLAKAGEIKKPKALPPVDDQPFALPPNWRWVRIREVTSDRGQRIPDGDFTYIDVTAINKEAGVVAEPNVLAKDEAPSRARKIAAIGDVLYSCVRPYLLNVAVLDKEFEPAPIASTAFAVLNGHGLVLPWYLWIALRSPFMVECVEENQRGQAYPAINDKDFSLLPFPLPPLAEQRRIVGKVEELMALLDRLEAARTAREAIRDRLTAASLARLTAPDAAPKAELGKVGTGFPSDTAQKVDSFPANASFALATLPALTTRPDQIKPLRKTILNLAVRGKLVAQDPTDEPACEGLRELYQLKQRQVEAGKLRKTPDPEIAAPPEMLPDSWVWVRPEQVSTAVPNALTIGPFGSNLVKADYRTEGVPLTFVADVTSGFKVPITKYVSVKKAEKLSSHAVRGGDLVVTKMGDPPGTPAIYPTERPDGIITADCLKWSLASHLVDVRFAYHAVASDLVHGQIVEITKGGAHQKISLKRFRNIFFPLPPLAEQHRIVAKVDALMALCDRLEAALTTADTTRARLLEALLHEALAPAAEAVTEAAE